MSQDEIICFDIFGFTVTISITICSRDLPRENRPSIGYHGSQHLMIYDFEKYAQISAMLHTLFNFDPDRLLGFIFFIHIYNNCYG